MLISLPDNADMKLNITEAKLGLRKCIFEVEVKGEATETMLKLATQSAKDGVKSALGSAARAALSVGLDKAGKAALAKTWTFDGHFNTAEAVAAAAKGVKSPDDITIISVKDDGVWVGGGTSLYDKVLPQYNTMIAANVAPELALTFARAIMPGFVPPAATPAAVEKPQDEAPAN